MVARRAPSHFVFYCQDPQNTEPAYSPQLGSGGFGALQLKDKKKSPLRFFFLKTMAYTDIIHWCVSLTVLILVMGASADHFGRILNFFIDRCGPQDSTRRRRLADQHFHWSGLRKLAVKFIEDLRILRESRGTEAKHVIVCGAAEPWVKVWSQTGLGSASTTRKRAYYYKV